MRLRQELLKEINENPLQVREILRDNAMEEALRNIGVLSKILELHFPSLNSKKKEGFGKTLCGINGTRHKEITCKKCIQFMK